jgi:aryl-alcohol dehydrogenase (NADP+)
MSFGTHEKWMIPLGEARAVIKKALDLGINFFDTANVYSGGDSENIVGKLLKGVRDDVVIATKVYFPVGEGPNDSGLSRFHIMREVDRSLKRLRTDRIDLYQIHRWDYGTPIRETLETMDDLVHKGKVRYIGASSMYAWQFAKALHTSEMHALVRFVSMQNHYNLVYREEEREMIPLCADEKIAIIPWSPLARGFLSGKYRRDGKLKSKRYAHDTYLSRRYFRPEDFDVVERAEEVAAEKGVSTAQIALAWLFKKGVTAPVIGATKVKHIEEAVESLYVSLDVDDVRRLEEPYRPHPILGHT